jgi:hypothetical protein
VGEVGLVAAFLAQVVTDARSDNAFFRAEAVQFLSDHAAVTFWTEMVDLDAHAFVERVRQLL